MAASSQEINEFSPTRTMSTSHDSEDDPGGSTRGPQQPGSQTQHYHASSDLSLISHTLSEGIIAHNESNNNNEASPGECNTDPESLVGMYLEVRQQTGNTVYSLNADTSNHVDTAKGSSSASENVGFSSRIPGKGRIMVSHASVPTLASMAKSKKSDIANGNDSRKVRVKVRSSSFSDKAKPKSKIPTSKPKPISSYPAKLCAAVDEAKANIAKMMRSVEEGFPSPLDQDVSTYIQNVSDVSDIATLKRDPTDELSDEDSDLDNDCPKSQATYEGYQSSAPSGNHYETAKSVSSLEGYETPAAGMSVSDSNLMLSSNPGTGSPSDVEDDDDESAPQRRGSRDSGSRGSRDSRRSESAEQLLGAAAASQRSGSDSSLEPGMQRAKLFVAINQGQFPRLF